MYAPLSKLPLVLVKDDWTTVAFDVSHAYHDLAILEFERDYMAICVHGDFPGFPRCRLAGATRCTFYLSSSLSLIAICAPVVVLISLVLPLPQAVLNLSFCALLLFLMIFLLFLASGKGSLDSIVHRATCFPARHVSLHPTKPIGNLTAFPPPFFQLIFFFEFFWFYLFIPFFLVIFLSFIFRELFIFICLNFFSSPIFFPFFFSLFFFFFFCLFSSFFHFFPHFFL